MKSIIYTLIAIFICGLIASGFTSKPSTSHTILLQSTDSKISSVALSQSADIISMRLKSFSSEKFDVKIFTDMNQIQVILPDNQNVEVVENLITQKGIIGFFETYDYQSLNKLLKGDSTLLKLLRNKTPINSSPNLGCIPSAEKQSVNAYLNTTRLDDKCRFAWSNLFDDTDICLYALKIDEGGRISLTDADIQSFEAKYDSIWHKDYIDFKFKKPAVQVWADATKRNLSKAIAMVMDNNVIFAPLVNEEINGGNCSISGDFTKEKLRYIAAVGSGGALPVSFMVVK